MSSPSVTVPAPVRTSFLLFLSAVPVSVANAGVLAYFQLAPARVFLNPVVELALFLAIGLAMRKGNRGARLGMLSLALLLIAVNLVFTYGLTRAFGELATYKVVLLLVLVTGKIALLAAATAMMYRPRNQLYFG